MNENLRMKLQLVIPARGGSKRLVGKNIIDFNGLPLIAHSIIFAQANLPGQEVYVNTDSVEIANVALRYGAKITNRPDELALDTTTSLEVLQHQLSWFEENNIPCDGIILLQSTNPLRPDNLLQDSIVAFKKSGRQSLAGFSVLHKKFGLIDSKGFFRPENYSPGQRMQDLTPRYFENGLIYITTADSVRNGAIITEDVYPFIVDHISSTVDIDELSDLIYASYIANHLKNHE